MNVAYFLTPKNEVGCIYDDCTLRQGLEKMKRSGFTALPVVTRENRYVGTVSEGDFLWYLVQEQEKEGDESLRRIPIQNTEDAVVRDVLRFDRNPPVRITAGMEQLVHRAMNQNFIPVIDDLGSFIGIVTRKDIIRYFYEKNVRPVPTPEYA
ncbi:MAG: CBS domain-containing protein [Clostridia bacterium]|nr:CBS domain-containing protein [Clostridia bacterium]